MNFGKVLGLSTRKGNTIILEELFDEAKRRILAYMREHPENRPELEDEEAVAEELGKAAIFFSDLSRQRIKDVAFDWDRVCSFDGDTGPYLVNAFARIAGIIRKSGVELDPSADLSLLAEPEAQALVLARVAVPRGAPRRRAGRTSPRSSRRTSWRSRTRCTRRTTSCA